MKYCYGCNKIRPEVIELPCAIQRCEKCTRRHLEGCPTCSLAIYVNGRGEVDEIVQPAMEVVV